MLCRSVCALGITLDREAAQGLFLAGTGQGVDGAFELGQVGSNPAIPTISAVQGACRRLAGRLSRSSDRHLTVGLKTDWRYWSARTGSGQPAGRACGRSR